MIIAIISLVWMVVWKLTVLDTMPDKIACVNPVKGLVGLMLGGPIVWFILVIYFTFHGLKFVVFPFITPLKRVCIKFWGQHE